MTPYTSIAQIINELKPNLKEFWSTINPSTAPTDILDIYKANLLIAQQALNKLIKDL